MDEKYDVIIVGSGLGGLECGVMLSKEGYKVCVLEQASVFGGCLQTFQRGGHQIDTGIHYVGSMGEGQIMRQYLKYFGIFDDLDIIKLDSDFDVITLGDKGEFRHRGGYENFIEELSSHFPDQRVGLERYCSVLKSIGQTINIDVHKGGAFSTSNIDYLSVSAVKFIEECISDPLLQGILSGANLLCGSTCESANLYHHAMISHSNIEGAYRFVGGTQSIADLMADKIRENGGTLLNRAKVVRFEMDQSVVKSVELEDGRRLYADKFISNLHPMTTFEMVEQTPRIKKAYRTRLSLLPNTYGIFSVYLGMRQGSSPYINKNLYYYKSDDVWDIMVSRDDMQIKSILMSSQLSRTDANYSDVVTLMTPVGADLFAPFTDSKFGARGNEYKELKEEVTQNIIDYTSKSHPHLMESVESIYSSTPLTYQHYTATPQGSAYGLLKGYRNSLATLIPSRTKIENLFLTGQNLNVHGVLGVTLTAATTCGELLGTEYLSKKIGKI